MVSATAPLPAALPTEESTGEPAGASAEERGNTRIDSRVVERIAAVAAAEVDGVVAGGRRLSGSLPGGQGATRVQAAVTGTRATVRAVVTLTYPISVREVTRRLQVHVSDRVTRLTGLRVGTVDVQVRALASEVAARVR